MLRAIVGFLNPSKGTIEINGKVINHIPVEDRGIGMVFQSYALFPTMTVYDNIAFGLKIDKKDKAFIDKRVHQMGKMVDLTEEQLQKNVAALSGGQQQRVAIARALAKQPEILAMDEPLSNLDAKLRKQLRRELKNIQHNLKVTSLYVTHDQEEALTLSDRIAVFSNGKLEQVGTPKEIYSNPKTEFVCTFIGDSNKIPAEIVQRYLPKIYKGDSSVYYVRPEDIKTERYAGQELKENQFICEFVSEDFYGTYINFTLKEVNSGTNIITFEDSHIGGDFVHGDQVLATVNIDEVKIF